VNLNDGKVCPDCMAIAAQQAHEGYTWDEWIQFGVPRAGHTRCGDHCRCRLTPYLYVDVSTELQHMSIMAEGEMPARTQRVLDMVRQWEEAGYDAGELELMGLTEKEMLEYIESRMIEEGIEPARYYYHVVRRGWDGEDLLSYEARINEGIITEAQARIEIEAKWPDYPFDDYMATDGQFISLFESVGEAQAYAEEYGGEILQINVAEMRMIKNPEGYQMIRDRIPAKRLKRLKKGS